MKKLNIYLLTVLISSLFVFTNCGNKQSNLKNVEENLPAVNEAEVLYNYLQLSGDFINAKRAPTMITVSALNSELKNPAFHIIDMRSASVYEAGHIEGAVNVLQSEIYDYFKKKINASKYEKIIIVCKSGQSASYVTSVLQLIGYKNVYALKRGMSGWNKIFAENIWLKNAGNSFSNQLETEGNTAGGKTELPKIETGKRSGIDILEARAKEVLSKTAKDWGVRAKKVFENPDDYYIVNYWAAAKYNVGHIPTAIQYTPKESLSKTEKLATLPTDKPIALYCYTGQHAAFAVAYLRILGYNANSVLYGANGFMNDKMKEGGVIGHAFTKAEVMDFPYIVGPNPTDKPETIATEAPTETKTTAPRKKKKKVAEEEGGC